MKAAPPTKSDCTSLMTEGLQSEQESRSAFTEGQRLLAPTTCDMSTESASEFTLGGYDESQGDALGLYHIK